MEKRNEFESFAKGYLKDNEEEILNVYDRYAGLKDGAIWQKEKLIEKACEWWENELSYPSMTQEEIRWYKNKVNAFRKAMMED